MNKRERVWAVCLVGAAIAAALMLPVRSQFSSGTASKPQTSGGSPVQAAKPVSISKADAGREAQLVAAEDRRLEDLRTISTLARWQNRAQRAPYRVGTPAGYTLMLTARRDPYVLSDLLTLEPQTLVRLSDGSYLLKEHIVVLDGAELDLNTPGLVLRLASGADGFSTIVSMGGRIQFIGSATRPLVITSWDETLGHEDLTTSDGRAYIRALGGQLQMSYVRVQDLGFWSGRTGGIALTGTDRPNTGSLDMKTVRSAGPSGSVGGLEVLPTGALPTGSASPSDADIYANTYVSARIDHTTVTGDAFGLFASGSDGIAISDSRFVDSQIAGIDFHRFVTGSTIERTVSNGSGGDGFNLGRATQGVQISQCDAQDNAHNGFNLSGAPLADGPSAVGSPISRYGNNVLSNSTAAYNGHYGIDLEDGFNLTVSGNHVTSGLMGIVAESGASNVSINGNQVSGTSSHGIALLDQVTHSTVTGNVVKGAPIYLRDSQAAVVSNTVMEAQGHAISVVGSSSGTTVANNVATGSGSSAIDTARAHGAVNAHDNVDGSWHDTTSLLVQYFHMMLHPMSLLWAAILVLVLLSMVKGLRRGAVRPGTDPYPHQSAHLVSAGTA